MEALLILPTLILGALLWQERHDRATAEAAWRKERTDLLTRIQVPELAPSLTSEEPSDEPLYIPYGDDTAHDQYVEQRALGELL